MKRVALFVVAFAVASTARAAVQSKPITYSYGGASLKGVMFWDDAVTGKRPGILVVHEWWGLNEYAKERAAQLAGLGYVAFACDMYGDGKYVEHPMEATALATAARKNVDEWRGRALAGLKILKENEFVDPTKTAAIGYCFGGSTSLQLAYAGADLKAVVSFHGALPVPDEATAKAIKAKVLICHGALDSFIPEETIAKVRAAFEGAKVDYRLVYYGGAVHSFTVKEADKHNLKGMAYNAEADKRSWQDMRDLFNEVFK